MVALLCGVKKEGMSSSKGGAYNATNDQVNQPALYAIFDMVVALSSCTAIAVSSAFIRTSREFYIRNNIDSSAGTL